jgi:Tol biopolymer transport system component
VGGISGPGTSQLAVVSAGGGNRSDWTLLTPVDVSADKPRWSTDGTRIYFTASNGGIINLWSIPFDCARGLPAGTTRRQTAFTGPAEQLLPDIGPLEIGLAKNRAVLPVVQQTGAVWLIERQP